MNHRLVLTILAIAMTALTTSGSYAGTTSFTFRSGEIAFDGTQFKGSTATLPEHFLYEVQYDFNTRKAADKVKVDNHPSGLDSIKGNKLEWYEVV